MVPRISSCANRARLAVLCVGLGCMGVAHSERYHVDMSAVGGDGLTWGTAFTRVEHALELAVAGDEICVAEGEVFPGIPMIVSPPPEIDPVIVAVSSEDDTPGFDHSALRIVDGSGLASGAHSATSNGTMWLSAVGQPTGAITIDLGATAEIASMRIWNFNHSGVFDLTNKGARDVRLSVSPAVDEPLVHLADIVVPEATGASSEGGDLFDLEGALVRLLRLEITANHGDPDQVGLSEIAFEIVPPEPAPVPSTLQVPAGVVLLGGFSAGGGEQRERDPSLYRTVLSGDLEGDDPIADLTTSTQPTEEQSDDNLRTVIELLGDGAVLDGFTVTRSYSGGFHPPSGGVLTHGRCELRNLRVRNNFGVRGGGVHVADGAPVVEATVFERNLAIGSGGGFYGAVEAMRDVEFVANRAGLTGLGAHGGGAAITGSCVLEDVTFLSNRISASASGFNGIGGGGLALLSGDAICTIRGAEFRSNTTGFDVAGAAIASNGELRLYDVAIQSNANAGASSGAIVFGATVTLERCSFLENIAPGGGGAVSGVKAMTDCEVSNNSASAASCQSDFLVERCRIESNRGGVNGVNGVVRNSLFAGNDYGVSFATALMSRVENVTLVDNVGSALVIGGGSPSVILTNSIIWNNGVAVGGSGGLSLDSTNYIIQGVPGASSDPLLDATFHPLEGSPAIDAGTNSVVGIGDLDLLGRRRVVGGTVDLGAYEVAEPARDMAIFYSFDGSQSGTIFNLGSRSDNGTLLATDAPSAIVAGSPVAGGERTMLYCNATGGSAATHVDTGVSASDLGLLADGDYTMAAWFKAESLPTASPPDAMVFGQPSGTSLHLGIRDNRLHFGHWFNDSDSGTTTVDAGRWYHAVWRYEGGVQTIFLDGAKVSEAARGPVAQDGNILVGTTLFIRDKDFEGWIDEVVIDDRGWTDDEVIELYQGGLAGDLDGDGISDVVEENTPGLDSNDPSDALGDPDGDGSATLLELYSGTGTMDSSSRPGLEITRDGSDVTIGYFESIAAAATAVGTIEVSADGQTWQEVSSVSEVSRQGQLRYLEALISADTIPVRLARLRVALPE